MSLFCPACGEEFFAPEKPLEFAGVRLEARALCWRGEKVHLTQAEYEILRLFFQVRGRVVTGNYLFDFLYSLLPDSDQPATANIGRVWICRLRKKLADLPIKIETVWGTGWKLVEMRA